MNVLLIGGNGYIGQEVLRQWLERDATTQFYIVSRSGRITVRGDRVHTLSADFTARDPALSGLPPVIDCVVDFIGRPERDLAQLRTMNEVPVDNMIKLAEMYHVPSLGFIGGILGPKSFVRIKADMIKKLKDTGKRVSYVEPSIVYGGGRADRIAKLVPLFKFFGLFSRGMKPVKVEQVAGALLDQLLKA